MSVTGCSPASSRDGDAASTIFFLLRQWRNENKVLVCRRGNHQKSPPHIWTLTTLQVFGAGEGVTSLTRWGRPAGRWWCPSAAPSSSPRRRGGRRGTPAGPSAWTEPRPARPRCPAPPRRRRAPPPAGWGAPRPGSGLPTSGTSATSDPTAADLRMTFKEGKKFRFSATE